MCYICGAKLLNFVVMNYENCKIPDAASAVKHLGALTGVECRISEVPFFKEKGLYSLPTVSEDIVRIASKYGLQESVTGDLCTFGRQFARVLNALSHMGVFSETEFDRFFEE